MAAIVESGDVAGPLLRVSLCSDFVNYVHKKRPCHTPMRIVEKMDILKDLAPRSSFLAGYQGKVCSRL